MYFFGGCVRDWKLRGSQPDDVDLLITESTVEDVIPFLEESDEFTPLNNAKFTDVRWIVNRERGTLKCRSDIFGVVDIKVTPGDLLSVLSTRDFTINAMAIDAISGEWHDPMGGREDWEDEVLVMVNGRSTYHDSPERLIRAARFMQLFDMQYDVELEELFFDSEALGCLSECNKDVKLAQLKKWTSQCSPLDVIQFLAFHSEFQEALTSNLRLEFRA